MLPVFVLESADADMAKLTEYIGKRDIHAAERLWKLLRECVLPWSEHPFLYRISGRVAGLREVVAHPNYIVLYRVTAIRVEVVNVVHARREYPEGEGPHYTVAEPLAQCDYSQPQSSEEREWVDVPAVGGEQIGRAHVRTPVTNAHLVCRLLLEKTKRHIII